MKKQSKEKALETLLLDLVNVLRANEDGLGDAVGLALDTTENALEDLGLTRHVLCPACQGEGEDEGGAPCLICEGAGNILPEDI